MEINLWVNPPKMSKWIALAKFIESIDISII